MIRYPALSSISSPSCKIDRMGEDDEKNEEVLSYSLSCLSCREAILPILLIYTGKAAISAVTVMSFPAGLWSNKALAWLTALKRLRKRSRTACLSTFIATFRDFRANFTPFFDSFDIKRSKSSESR